MQPSIVIYSAPGCFRCKFTAKAFERAGVEYSMLEDQETAALLVEQHGLLKTLPVVQVTTEEGSQYWSDLNTGRIEEAIQISRASREAFAV